MAIRFENISYAYESPLTTPYQALNHIDLLLQEQQFIALIGQSGSGKSTLLQLLNGLLLPSEGKLCIADVQLDSTGANVPLKQLRKRVGLVFQFPEHQLFSETVIEDLCFGPKNFGATDQEAFQAAKDALVTVGLDASFLCRNPFHLSGGQKRKVAIAAVLATDPDILILDEPTAGLDPQSRMELISMLQQLCLERHKTILIVSHRLEEIMTVIDTCVILHEGNIVFQGSVCSCFEKMSDLSEYDVIFPPAFHILQQLNQYLPVRIPCDPALLHPQQFAAQIAQILEKRSPND